MGAGLFQTRIVCSIRPVGNTALTRVLASVVAACVYLLLRAGAPDPDTTGQLAYIGPGAGIALLGSFFAILIALLSAIAVVIFFPFFLLWWAIRGRKRYVRIEEVKNR